MTSYAALFARNAGYIDPELQQRIRATRLLVAGCGLGSIVAEIALRTGFERLVLIDGDRIEAHNLNRQAYSAADLGCLKVDALARRLREIHPDAKIETGASWVDAGNAASWVSRCDLVIDTIDFLDLPAILSLHAAAREQEKPVLSGFPAGWGGCAFAFLPGGSTLADLLGLPASGPLDRLSYQEHFRRCFQRLAPRLPVETIAVMSRVLDQMVDGKSCPAPQLAIGTHAAAALLVTLAVRVVANLPTAPAPELLLIDLIRTAAPQLESVE